MNLDLVLPGCGLAGYYWVHLDRALALHGVCVRRIYCASSGASAAVLLACGCDSVEWLHMYHMFRGSRAVRLADVVFELLDLVLPPDAHVRCSGRVFIRVHELSPTRGLVSTTVSEYATRDMLLAYVRASMAIPFVTIRGACVECGGRFYLDGVTNPCPDPDFPTLVVRHGTNMSYWSRLVPTLSDMRPIAESGERDVHRFFGAGCVHGVVPNMELIIPPCAMFA